MAPPSSSSSRNNIIATSIAIADAASWCCAIILLSLILVTSIRDNEELPTSSGSYVEPAAMRGSELHNRPCDEIYVVGEGETLHTISDKCGDSFIVERNPHIHDPDDVFPGLVIKITPTKSRKALR